MVGEVSIVYGLGAVAVLVLARTLYKFATLTVPAVVATLVLGSGLAALEPRLIQSVAKQLPALRLGDIAWRVPAFFTTEIGVQAFVLHVVLGFVGSLLVYWLMAVWYPAGLLSGVGWIFAVWDFDQYVWTHAMPTVEYGMLRFLAGASGAATGFATGWLFGIVLLEPLLQHREPRSQFDLDVENLG